MTEEKYRQKSSNCCSYFSFPGEQDIEKFICKW